MNDFNYKVETTENGRKVFHIQLPDGMTTDQVKDWLEKFKHEFRNRPSLIIENID